MMKRISLLLLLFSIGLSGQILFEDDASIAGLTEHTGSIGNGNGLSFVDYDGDGWDDITLPSGNGVPLRFYKNYNGFFVQELLLTNQITYQTRGVSWVDFDNDGDKDLFVISDTNGNRLFKQKETGLFSNITTSAGLPEDNLETYAVTWGDINNDGCLDLYLSNRVSAYAVSNYLFQNNCDGTFTNVTDSIGLANTPALTLCASFFDFNNDGWQDLYVSNDKEFPNFLYKNNGNGTFTDVSAESGTGIIVDAMSVTIDDYNSDGYFDIYITNTPSNAGTTTTDGSVLYRNNGDETFTDVAISTGTQLNSWSWGANFLDAENDGDLDLYVSCSYISSDGFPSFAFYENESFETFSTPSNIGFENNQYRSYGSAIGDSNNDGKTDIIVINNLNTLPNLWNNKSTSLNNYLSINLIGTQSNKDGVGSVIEISVEGNKQYRYVINGESYLSQNSFKENFGIGTNDIVDYVKVKWLSGIEDVFYNVMANQTLNIVEGIRLSIESLDKEEVFKIFPNPVREQLNLSARFPIISFKIISLVGEVLLEKKDINKRQFTLEIDNLSNGVYFINAKDTNDNHLVLKFIKS